MTPYGTFIETRCVSVTTPGSDALADGEIVGAEEVGLFSTLRGDVMIASSPLASYSALQRLR